MWITWNKFCFSSNKIITTGAVGAIITNNKKLALLAKHLSTTSKIQHNYEYIHDSSHPIGTDKKNSIYGFKIGYEF